MQQKKLTVENTKTLNTNKLTRSKTFLRYILTKGDVLYVEKHAWLGEHSTGIPIGMYLEDKLERREFKWLGSNILIYLSLVFCVLPIKLTQSKGKMTKMLAVLWCSRLNNAQPSEMCDVRFSPSSSELTHITL